MKQIDVREGARRQHRIVGLFCVLQCWQRGLDGVRISREQLKRLLGLEKFKTVRCQWMLEDLGEYFQYRRTYPEIKVRHRTIDFGDRPYTFSTESIDGSLEFVEISRVNFESASRIESLLIWKMINSKEEGILEAFAPFMSESANYDERLMSSYLSLLCQGQISPSQLPSLTE
ncbi:hypothetical protein V3W47_06650 [Deinococcus sp. YIM 134068]|uniref:hypothetical protein n=1 Tax=Deinococcus lichenicola TaxID=3118910 RepID=UPI002F944FFC